MKLAGSILATLAIGIAAPFAALAILWSSGHDVGPQLYIAALVAVVIDLGVLTARGITNLRPLPTPRAPGAAYPPASAIILPGDWAESDNTHVTVSALLAMPYLNSLQIVVVCRDTQHRDQILSIFEESVSEHLLVAVQAENSDREGQMRTALAHVTGEFFGIFDAGQIPRRDAFTRAWLWLSTACDLLQGHRAIGNDATSPAAAMAAIEAQFDGWLAGAVPKCPGSLLWSASNVYCRTSLARGIASGEREDGYSVGFDRLLATQEPTLTSIAGWWEGRLRNERAWLQMPVSQAWTRMHPSRAWRGKRVVLLDRLLWRPAYAWLSLLAPTVIAYRIWHHGTDRTVSWLIPLIVLAALYLCGANLLKAYFAKIVAPSDVVREGRWPVRYGLFLALFLVGLEGTAARVAQLRLILGRRELPSPVELVPVTQSDAEEADQFPDLTLQSTRVSEESRVAPRVSIAQVWSRPVVLDGYVEAGVINAARRVSSSIGELINQIDLGVSECRRLQICTRELQKQIVRRESLQQAVHDIVEQPVDQLELQSVLTMLSSLAENPGRITALASIPQHAHTLAGILAAYTRVQDILEVDRSAGSEAIADPAER